MFHLPIHLPKHKPSCLMVQTCALEMRKLPVTKHLQAAQREPTEIDVEGLSEDQTSSRAYGALRMILQPALPPRTIGRDLMFAHLFEHSDQETRPLSSWSFVNSTCGGGIQE